VEVTVQHIQTHFRSFVVQTAVQSTVIALAGVRFTHISIGRDIFQSRQGSANKGTITITECPDFFRHLWPQYSVLRCLRLSHRTTISGHLYAHRCVLFEAQLKLNHGGNAPRSSLPPSKPPPPAFSPSPTNSHIAHHRGGTR
jgi:hypothetical protein